MYIYIYYLHWEMLCGLEAACDISTMFCEGLGQGDGTCKSIN